MDEKILERLAQIGTVTAIQGTTARVLFPDTQITSDWLPILQRKGELVRTINAEAGKHTHDISTPEGSGSASESGNHTHTATSEVVSWVPQIGTTVLVIYLPVFNSDGFIIGGI